MDFACVPLANFPCEWLNRFRATCTDVLLFYYTRQYARKETIFLNRTAITFDLHRWSSYRHLDFHAGVIRTLWSLWPSRSPCTVSDRAVHSCNRFYTLFSAIPFRSPERQLKTLSLHQPHVRVLLFTFFTFILSFTVTIHCNGNFQFFNTTFSRSVADRITDNSILETIRKRTYGKSRYTLTQLLWESKTLFFSIRFFKWIFRYYSKFPVHNGLWWEVSIS